MFNQGTKQPLLAPLVRAVLVVALAASMLVTSAPLVTQPASAISAISAVSAVSAMENIQTLEVWGISGGIVDNPKQWKFRQSDSAANDIGSASAAALGLDDSAWATRTLRWRELPGANVANHFRKDFTLADIGVTRNQIEGIRVQLQYDDTAVLYLNGIEVYRSIRGNLDPDYTPYAIGDDLPYDVAIPHGGAEQFYVRIPNSDNHNECEFSGPTCPSSPYGDQNPPEIPATLLNDGVNTWSVTTWNQSGGGSGDSSLNHVFELLVNDQPPNPIFINEVVASNDGSWPVDIDDDPVVETPDWFELINTSSEAVNLAGWTISDSGASWVFPSVTIAAGGYLTVAASDNNRTDTDPLQTNFKLSSEGDSLKLTNPSGVVADEYVSMPQQFTDNAYGRPNDAGVPTYLATTTPDGPNSAAGSDYDPILRLFANRQYNNGETVSDQVNAFDPDGDALSYSMSPEPPGLNIDAATGLITGAVTTVGRTTTTITVTDADGAIAFQENVDFDVLAVPTGPAPIVLNEYNAVRDDRELLGGSVVGNGGDWFEFVVVEDELDLRGYTIELFDRKGADDQLRRPASSVTFADVIELARVPAGTIITISEDFATDLGFDAVNDWSINLQIDNVGNGAFFQTASPSERFNSTRAGQTVLIRDSSGTIVTPLSGETEAWDQANGGVSGGEVMNLCVNPSPGMTLDPVTAYRDNGTTSTFGLPNTCVYVDPINPGTTITFNQNLSSLRATATFGAQGGDTNCDLNVDILDALLISFYEVGNIEDSGPCFFDQGGPGVTMYAGAGDFNQDGSTNVLDALVINRCVVGLDTPPWC